MKGLVLKDLYTIKKQFWFIGFYVILFSVFGIIGQNMTMYSVFFTMFTGMMPITALSFDERSKWSGYAVSLPVTRAASVISKYLLGLIFIVPIAIYNFIVYLIDNGIQADNVVSGGILYTVLISSVGIILLSIMLPLMFKFGTEKGRIVLILIYVFFGAVFGAIIAGMSSEVLGQLMNNQFIGTLISAPMILALSAFIISILLMVLSICISIRIYNKKEF